MKIDFHTHQQKEKSSEETLLVYCHANFREELPPSSAYDYFFVGLHPWFLPEGQESKKRAFSFLKKHLQHPQCLGLGECGLDRLKGADFAIQWELLKEQLDFAHENKVSHVVLHCVRAYPEMIKTLKESKYCGTILFHDYGANADITSQLLKLNQVKFSLGRALERSTFKENSLPLLPKERVLLETDDELLAISTRYQQLADAWNMPVNEVEDYLSKTFQNLL